MASIEDKMAAIEAGAAKAAGADQDEELITGHLDEEQLKEMTVKELKALADDMGLKYDPKIKKDDLVALIAAEPVQAEKAAIEDGDVDQTDATEAADGLLIGVDLAAADPEEGDPQCKEITLHKEDKVAGRALVTYTGLVNLRDDQLHVVGQAMQGQVFPVVAKREQDGKTWYRVEDQAGKQFLISGDVVRFMA